MNEWIIKRNQSGVAFAKCILFLLPFSKYAKEYKKIRKENRLQDSKVIISENDKISPLLITSIQIVSQEKVDNFLKVYRSFLVRNNSNQYPYSDKRYFDNHNVGDKFIQLGAWFNLMGRKIENSDLFESIQGSMSKISYNQYINI